MVPTVFGADVLALILWGARTSLLVGLCSALAALAIGSIWGSVSALAGGAIETIMMRLVDVLLSVPSIIALLFVAALLNELPFRQILPPAILNLLGITNYSNGLFPC